MKLSVEAVKNFAPHMDDLTLEELEEIVGKLEEIIGKYEKTEIKWDAEGNRLVDDVKQIEEKPLVQ